MEEPIEGTPAPQVPNYDKVIEELKAANVALVEKMNALEERNKAQDAKITALSGQAQAAAKKEMDAGLSNAKSELETAYEKAMKELGIFKEE